MIHPIGGILFVLALISATDNIFWFIRYPKIVTVLNLMVGFGCAFSAIPLAKLI